jgi:hypothetical protein
MLRHVFKAPSSRFFMSGRNVVMESSSADTTQRGFTDSQTKFPDSAALRATRRLRSGIHSPDRRRTGSFLATHLRGMKMLRLFSYFEDQGWFRAAAKSATKELNRSGSSMKSACPAFRNSSMCAEGTFFFNTSTWSAETVLTKYKTGLSILLKTGRQSSTLTYALRIRRIALLVGTLIAASVIFFR